MLSIRIARTLRVGLLGLLVMLGMTANAGPFADPGDDLLRHDLELLADKGHINLPLSTWPISMADVEVALFSVNQSALSSLASQLAYRRLSNRLAQARKAKTLMTGYRLAASDNGRTIRVFEDTPRANLEMAGQASYLGEYFAVRLRAEIAVNPSDDKNFRLDGSYLAGIFKNTVFSLGYQDKWWGPGWGGTLGLSTSARPVPGLLISRSISKPLELPVLRRLGPWTGQVFFGQLETNRAVEQPFLFGARFAFKPHQRIEIGVSRTAQWGGEGRPNSLDSFFDMLLGRDNVGSDGIGISDEPGNQLAGFDARWTVRRGRHPVNVYAQLMGEDEAGGFPSKYLGQFGVAGHVPAGQQGSTVHWRAEFSDTTCQFNENSRIFNCAYNNSTYPTGYRYRGRPIGHSTDNDARQFLVAGQWVTPGGQRYMVAARSTEINRGGAPDFANSITPTGTDQINVEFSHERQLFDGKLAVGVGIDQSTNLVTDQDETDGRLFVRWSSSTF